jgi:tetratricopeptide (TPR) repeat protein
MSSFRSRGLALGLLCVALVNAAPVIGLANVAYAADEPARPKLTEAQKQEIRDRYDRATKYYYLRKYSEAIAEYEAIYLISADPVMLYNIAQSYRNADQPETASQFYKNYLRNAPAAPNRADVEKKIVEMDRLVEERKAAKPATPAAPPPLVIPSPAPSASPSPPDIGVGTPPPVAAEPGPVTPAPTPAEMGGPATIDLGTTAPPPPRASHALRWSMLIGGGVFLTTSLVLASVAGAKASDIEDAARPRNRAFDQDLQRTESDGRAASALAVGTGLLGAVGLGAGIYLWVTESARERAVARTTVVPVAGAGYAGALLRTRF